MKAMKSIAILFLLSIPVFNNAWGQKADNSPEVIAKGSTSWLVKAVNIDSVAARKVYNCFLTFNKESDLIMKKTEEKKSMGTYIKGEFKENWNRIESKKDSCLRQILTTSQYKKWKEEENKYNYKHDEGK